MYWVKVIIINRGAYGKVFRVKDKKSKHEFAVKKIKFTEQGVPRPLVREIKFLMNLDHKNILKMIDFKGGSSLYSWYLILELCECSLAHFVDFEQRFTQAQVKCIFKDIMEGLNYLHQNKIIHRDIKPLNILLSNKGIVKIADFGLARYFDSKLTPYVGSLHYKSPEVLLKLDYLFSLDIFSCGCILAELLLFKPFLMGRTELDQINLIVRYFGVISESNMPGFDTCIFKFRNDQFDPQRFPNEFEFVSDATQQLLLLMFELDPRKRISAENVLTFPYFSELPYPVHHSLLPLSKYR